MADGAEGEVVAGVLGGGHAEAVVEGDDEGLHSSTWAGVQVSSIKGGVYLILTYYLTTLPPYHLPILLTYDLTYLIEAVEVIDVEAEHLSEIDSKIEEARW